ncbi:uncharacterized protein LOC105703694 [Orussus abietinus]|uniref:uncharacterized protein LOC105703694 n=1 Tax=Orussus abietinus TaxID=222816 RepID=UPI00062683AA|nr:uncharacterized protein LOC105703694 [Orussus abietinus]
MLEWFGICCCSSFISCMCSVIATVWCLSPRRTYFRDGVKPDRNSKMERPNSRSDIEGKKDSMCRNKGGGAEPQLCSMDDSCTSCTCIGQNFIREPFSHVPYASNPGYGMPGSCRLPCQLTTNSPCCVMSGRPISHPNCRPMNSDISCRPVPTENDIKKTIDEYNTVFKQYNDLMTKEAIRLETRRLEKSASKTSSFGLSVSAATGIDDYEINTPGNGEKMPVKKMKGSKRHREKQNLPSKSNGKHKDRSKKRSKERVKNRSSRNRCTCKPKSTTSSKCCCERKDPDKVKKSNSLNVQMNAVEERNEREEPDLCCESIYSNFVNNKKYPSRQSSWLQKAVQKVREHVRKDENDRCCICNSVGNDKFNHRMSRKRS